METSHILRTSILDDLDARLNPTMSPVLSTTAFESLPIVAEYGMNDESMDIDMEEMEGEEGTEYAEDVIMGDSSEDNDNGAEDDSQLTQKVIRQPRPERDPKGPADVGIWKTVVIRSGLRAVLDANTVRSVLRRTKKTSQWDQLENNRISPPPMDVSYHGGKVLRAEHGSLVPLLKRASPLNDDFDPLVPGLQPNTVQTIRKKPMFLSTSPPIKRSKIAEIPVIPTAMGNGSGNGHGHEFALSKGRAFDYLNSTRIELLEELNHHYLLSKNEKDKTRFEAMSNTILGRHFGIGMYG